MKQRICHVVVHNFDLVLKTVNKTKIKEKLNESEFIPWIFLFRLKVVTISKFVGIRLHLLNYAVKVMSTMITWCQGWDEYLD